MSSRGRRGRPKDLPPVAIANATELLKSKKQEKAHNVLFEAISYRHRAQFDSTYEDAMKMYIDVGVAALKSCKEGFLQYRSLVQQNHPQSLARMINHLVDCVVEAGNKEMDVLGVDSEEQYESRTLKYEWESIQTVLMILRNNGKLNHVYMSIIKKAIAFCTKLKRTKELRKLCDTIRRRFGYVINNQHYDYALKINSSETLNAMIETRLDLLEAALSMSLHQESFKTIKSIQKNIINRAFDLKKNIDPKLYARFYKNLSIVFWSCNRYLLHSYAVFESYKRMKIYVKKISKKQKELKEEENNKLYTALNDALISVLVVPASSINDQAKGFNTNQSTSSNNKDFTHSLYELFGDFFGLGRKQAVPSKSTLLHDIIKEMNSYQPIVVEKAIEESAVDHDKVDGDDDDKDAMIDLFGNSKHFHQLIIIQTFKPLSFTASLNEIICKYEDTNSANIDFYMAKVYDLGVTVLLKQLASCYKSISWKRFKELTFSDDQLTDIELERIIAFSVYYGNVCCRISHSHKLISFTDNNVESTMFCNSIVELNAQLVRIKDEHNVIDANNAPSIQRQNVYNQIRNQITQEHDKITMRLSKIRRTRTDQLIIKRQKEKKKNEEIKKEKQAQKVKEQKEKEKVKESQKTIIEKQKNTVENEKKKTDAKQKWAAMLGKSSKQQPVANQSKNAWKSKKKIKQQTSNPNNRSKLTKIEKKMNMLTKEIELNLEKNIEAAAQKMAKMEKLQQKKKKKILESEEIEFDANCRASRKYLIESAYLPKIGEAKTANIKQQISLYKTKNVENKKKFFKSVQIRDRLREIRQRHVDAFLQIIERQQEHKKKQEQEKEQLQQQFNKQKPKQPKPKQKAKPKPKPEPVQQSPVPPKETKKKPEAKSKFKPRKLDSASAMEEKAASKPQKAMTFSQRMKAKRNAASSSGNSFGDRFSASVMDSQEFGSNNGRDRGRFGSRARANMNGNDKQDGDNIRPTQPK